MIVGGTKTDGTLNRTVYISYDNGVNWGQGSELLQLPKEIPTMTECDNVVMNVRKKPSFQTHGRKPRAAATMWKSTATTYIGIARISIS